MERHYVFVYGTLRKHERNHYLLKDAPIVAEQCWTDGKLFDSGLGYPFLAQSKSYRVMGELYLVTDKELQTLDRLEGYEGPGKNNYYNRVVQSIQTNIENLQAFVYVLPDERLPLNMVTIESGDWCTYRLRNQM